MNKIKENGIMTGSYFLPASLSRPGLYMILAVLILSSCGSQNNPVETSIRQFQVPVLKYR